MWKTIAAAGCAAGLWIAAAAGADPARLIAHRGGVVSDDIIENNVTSIETAVERGYWMAEVDVRRSRDGVPVAHHDADFRRYYGMSRRVSEMTWEEIAALRSTPGNEAPLRLVDYLNVCDGRMRIMLDVKGGVERLSDEYLRTIERVMAEHGQLATAYLIGTAEAKRHFRGKLRVSASLDEITAAREHGDNVASMYFLFPRGRTVTLDEIQQGLALGVPVVPSINTFHYPRAERLTAAQHDIGRLLQAGVTEFQIDSIYDPWLRPTSD